MVLKIAFEDAHILTDRTPNHQPDGDLRPGASGIEDGLRL
jgi:hypothetical protein